MRANSNPPSEDHAQLTAPLSVVRPASDDGSSAGGVIRVSGDMARVVLRGQAAFWRLWDRARREGAQLTDGTVRLNWNVSASSRSPCIAPRWAARIIGVRNSDLVRRRDREPSIHRVRLPGGVIDYHLPETEVTQVAEGVAVSPELTLGAIELWARCRDCDGCREHQRALWVARCVEEHRVCRGRSWFVTLTVRPVQRDLLLYQAIQKANAKAVNWHELPAEDRQKRLFTVFYAEVQKYLKRVRQELRVRGKRRLRFLCCVEPHKDGFPHAHLIIHEESFADANERVLRHKWWRMGQAKVRLVRNCQDAAIYVAKYVSKGAVIIRGSQHYGRSEPKPLLEPKRKSESSFLPETSLPDHKTTPPTPQTTPPTGGDEGGA